MPSPGNEDDEEINGRNVFDDESEQARHAQVGAAVELLESAFGAEDPAEDKGLRAGQQVDAEGADPEIEGVHRSEIFTEPNDEKRSQGPDSAKQRDGAAAVEPEPFLQKGDGRLQHGNGAGDGGEEEKEKPKEANPASERHVFENKRSVLKPRAKVPPTTPAAPRKMKAAGMVIIPPSDTSKNSLPATAVVELSAMSSLRRI